MNSSYAKAETLTGAILAPLDFARSFALVVGFSLLTALATQRFHWEGYSSPQHMLRSVSGAVLMGVGGATALGCSVGQGLTGLSTLALASFVAVAGIFLGTAIGLRGALRVRPLASMSA